MRRQQGISFFGLAILLAIVGGIVSIAIKIVPSYLDFMTVSSVTLETLKQPRVSMQTRESILEKIDKQLSINNLHLRDFGDRPIDISRDGGVVTAEIDYYVEKPVYSSEDFEISLNLHFMKTHEVTLGSE